ncbi:MAG TPA: transporter [Phycisphaerales bacterium]|nr:transporter [Phycisphaerales bacterium]
MSDRFFVGGSRAIGLVSAAAALASVAGCANPFGPDSGDYGQVVPVERLRSIGTLTLADYAAPEGEDLTFRRLASDPLSDPYAGLERLEVTVEQCRAWTLENNLDLQVSLIDPTIERVRLSGEEAKFESTFFIDANYANTDQPTSSDLQGSNAEFTDFTPGVTIPLRSGGTATVSLPTNRTETNNEFSTLNPAYTTDLRLSISQPLLRGAGRRANTHSIRIQSLESQVAEARAKLEVIRRLAEVERAYWTNFAARKALEVTQQQYELATEQLERARRRVRAQVAPEVEIIRAEDGVAARLEDIIRADNAAREAQRNLKRILNVKGMEIGKPMVLDLTSPPDPVSYKLDPDRLVTDAIANRMEMLEFELRLAQDYSSIDFARNQALPLFVMDYSYTINGLGSSYSDSLGVLRDNRFEDWTVGARFEALIGNEAAESRVHVAILNRLQRLASRAARELAIRQEVLNAVDGLESSWQRILAARQSVELAERLLRAEQNQFEVGARTSTDVLDAATRLADAQLSEIRAITDYQIAQVDLSFATGTLLGALKVDWEPRDPRVPPGDFAGERAGRVPLGPPGVPVPDPGPPPGWPPPNF